jgi:hypothetical protein
VNVQYELSAALVMMSIRCLTFILTCGPLDF